MTDRIAGAIRARIEAKETGGRATGVVAAVMAGDRVRTLAVGRSGEALPFRPEAPFLLYSFTKTVVAAAILRFVAAGRLALDGTLGDWLPEISVARRISLRQLLQHTSGLPDYGGLAAYHTAVRSGAPPWSEAEFLARTEADRLIFEPGQGWAYSNIGYMLLRRLLERLGGGTMAMVLDRQIFAPLGVTGASVPVRKENLAGFTFGPSAYLGGDGSPLAVAGHYHPGWIATGVIGAPMADMARLLHGIVATDLLPAWLRDEMRRAVRVGGPFPDRPWREAGYGLGLMMESSRTVEPFYGHTGAGPGCSPAAFHFPRREPPLTIAVVTDSEDSGQAEDMVLAAAGCLNGSGGNQALES